MRLAVLALVLASGPAIAQDNVPGTPPVGITEPLAAEPARAAAPELEAATDAPQFVGVYFWKQALWQFTADEAGDYSIERGDPWGGRFVVGTGFGRLGLEGRVDVSGLKDQFAIDDPETFQTLEVYTAAHLVAAAHRGVQVGPVAFVGSVIDENSLKGIRLNVYGFGVRFGGYGSEVHATVGRHEYLPTGGWRFSLSGHFPIYGKIYAVGDLVSGQDGYARVGVAVRIK